ncbi:MAG: TIGR01212 family radical SAM protein [Deltaproteobacteria bacterium]|nr:TIGR01212 family radical SAM protein [Deltaproteobacteria bacterium]
MIFSPDLTKTGFYPISQYYRHRFGERVHKISVQTADRCPNRNPSRPDQTCIFCDEHGSFATPEIKDLSLIEQIKTSRSKIAARFKVKKFLVYFQPYTSTFDKIDGLKRNIETALEEEQIVGVVLGTRPDCLPERIFPLLRDFHNQAYVAVELGVQCFDDEKLAFLRRGHTGKQSLDAIKKLHALSGVDIGLHLIFGLPGETKSDLIKTAEIINSLPVNNVKLHNLHVLKGTPLERLFERGDFRPVELEEYSEKVVSFIEHLAPHIAVQRLSASTGPHTMLVSPEWMTDHTRSYRFIIEKLRSMNSYQGKRS